MAYTENKSIDGLTAITPTTDDLVVTMDQSEVGVAKSSTLLSIYNLFKTTYDTVYAKYLGDADFYKYSIVTSVASGNLTVALKNYEGNDPTPTKPVKIQIGDVVRTITSALSVTINSGGAWFNAGSSELATKEIDYFTYLCYSSTNNNVQIAFARIPNGNTQDDFSLTGSNEKFISSVWLATFISTDPVVNIGRFNATLSAGAGYTWSIPATSVIINSPIYEMKSINNNIWASTITWSGGTTDPSFIQKDERYQIIGGFLHFRMWLYYTGGDRTSALVKMPFSANNVARNIHTTWSSRDIGSFRAFIINSDNMNIDNFTQGAGNSELYISGSYPI